MRDRKDTRGIKYTYYNGCFFYIASSQKQTGDFLTFNNLLTLFINIKIKDKTVFIKKTILIYIK